MNAPKGEIYFGVVMKEILQEILQDTGFARGELPVRYLVVPLITRRLTLENYTSLTDYVASRI